MQARSSQQRYADRHRETAAALTAAQERADASAAQVLQLRKDAAAKNDTIAWLEGQVQSAQQVPRLSYCCRCPCCNASPAHCTLWLGLRELLPQAGMLCDLLVYT